MSITSILNSTFIPLNSNSTWTGATETTNSHVTILSTIVCDTSCILNVYQTSNGVDIDFTDTFNILANVETNILQIQIKSKWFYISINNNSFTDQTYLRLITKLLAVQDTITETNSGTINTSIQLLHTDLTSTGIKIATLPAVQAVSYLGYRNINVGRTGSVVKASAGIVQSVMLCITAGNKYCYLKLYDKATTPTASDTPFITIPFLDNVSSPIVVPLYNYQFSAGLGIRGTDNIADADNTAPGGVMVTFISYI